MRCPTTVLRIGEIIINKLKTAFRAASAHRFAQEAMMFQAWPYFNRCAHCKSSPMARAGFPARHPRTIRINRFAREQFGMVSD